MPQYDDSFLVDYGRLERRLFSSSFSPFNSNKRHKLRLIAKHPRQDFNTIIMVAIKKKGVDSHHSSTHSTNTIGTSGHKNSLKGTKLARRARSFKDDLFEKISQMRTPTNTLGRSHSPHSPRTKHHKVQSEEAKSPPGLEYHVRQIKNALKHFKDVISKNKLEVLPGNGTVVLELIANMYAALQKYTLNENSSTLISATTQVYHSLGKLLKLCDEVLLSEDETNCASLNDENVKEVVDLVERAVQNLVNLANEKIKEKENSLTFSSSDDPVSSTLQQRSVVDVAGQRTSLPDIPLTPKERDILEKSISNPVRASHSTESILRDSSPPPKPPLPNRSSNPPPLPPKRRSQPKHNSSVHDPDFPSDASLLSSGLEPVSMRSRSPDDNSSLLSVSAGSLDSAFNHSREEDELKALTMDTSFEDHFLEDDVERMFAQSFASIRTSLQSVSTKRSSENSLQSQKSNLANVVVGENFGINRKIDFNSSESSADMRLSPTVYNQNKLISCFSNQKISSVEQCVTASCNFLKLTAGNCSKTLKSAQDETDSSAEDGKTLEKIIKMKKLCSDTRMNSLEVTSSDASGVGEFGTVIPPALPVKTRTKTIQKERHLSTYDNVDESSGHHNLTRDEIPELRHHHTSSYFLQSKHQSLMDPRRCYTVIDGSEQPPPLPVKKKHIIAYMEICSATSRGSNDPLRHSVHTLHSTQDHFSPNRNISHSQTMNLSPIRKQFSMSSQASLATTPILDEKPPSLPPKKQRINNCKTPTIVTTPPPSPKRLGNLQSVPEIGSESVNNLDATGRHSEAAEMPSSNDIMTTVNDDEIKSNATIANSDDEYLKTETINDFSNNSPSILRKSQLVETPPSSSDSPNHIVKSNNNICSSADIKTSASSENRTIDEDEEIDVTLLRRNNTKNISKNDSTIPSIKSENLPNLIEEMDISKYLVCKKENEDGPDIKGGYLDALVVHATKVQRNSENVFSEAFITTFRTFVTPFEVIEKLTHRYTIFNCQVNDQKQKAAKETFSLLVRVVNDLTASDLAPHLLSLLVEFVYQLVCSGQLSLAKLLRNKMVEKVLVYKEYKYSTNSGELQRNIVINQPTLLDLKSVEIAEQMTLLDAELFRKIEIPEVLLFAKEQCEEKSPNLNKFTEHFNKMSYWARSQILKQDDAKDREKHVIKFIKIMKHLRKMNNYNSYLALLSALDSAPIRRLEWHKTITEGLKEYCALIDSSSSFRIYRQALAETNPPCIPYIGLVLQDLTFVHVGNQDYLRDGIINFSKRWQQHNIIVNMKRFKKCSYPFKRNEKIIRFFENFENFLGEEQMWQISENIKPRGRKPQNTQQN